MQKIISVAAMRKSDAAEIANGTDSKTLMYRAGKGIFESHSWHGSIDIVTGSGNNAGDGYVLALLLHDAGIPCRIVLCSEKFSADGMYYFQKCQEVGIPVSHEADFSKTDVLVDCLLGTGFQGTLRPSLAEVVAKINASPAFVISVDINSGMHGDTGNGTCVRSDLTISIGYLKFGHLVGMVNGTIQKLINCDIGIPCHETFLPFFTAEDIETPSLSGLFLKSSHDFRLVSHLPEIPEAHQLLLFHTDSFLLLKDTNDTCVIGTSVSIAKCTAILEQYATWSERIPALLQADTSASNRPIQFIEIQ